MEKKTTMLVAIVAVIVILLAAIGALYATGNLGGGGDEKYTVSFVDGDNELSTVEVSGNSLVKQPADPVKEGYIFAGWYTDQELTNEFTFDDTYITNNLTLYAKWVKASEPEPGDITYTVTFNTNGANSISPQIVKAGDKAVKPADPLKSGYKFVGWYSDSSFTTLFDFQSPITFDITLYAKFTSTGGGGGSVTPPVTDTKFTVTFDTNGGTSVLPQSVVKGALVKEPTDPIKDGYTFAGWYEQNSSIKFDFNTPIISNLTLSAKWAPGTYTVEDDRSKVTVKITDEQIKEIITSSAEDAVTLIDASAMNDVTSVSVKTTTLQNAANSANNKDIVISLPNASLKLSSTVVDDILYNKQDKEIVFTATPVDEDPDVMGSIPEDVVLEDRPVYKFEITVDGVLQTNFDDPIFISIPYQLQEGEDPQHIDVFYVNNDGDITSESGKYNSETACVDVTLAHLSKFIIVNKAKFTVTFDSKGGSAVPPETNVNYNSKIDRPSAPTKTGYTFAGWYTSEGKKWIFSDNPSQADRVKSDLTLYAYWSLIDYKITYNLDDQQSSQTPATYTASEAVTLPTPVKAGHTFSGWYDNPGLKGTPITTIAEGSTGDITLYAKFQQITYIITLPADNAYIITPSGSHTVKEGESFAFNIQLVGEYVNSNIIVKANGTVLSGSEGCYTLESVSENITIAIEGIVKTKYSITFPQGAGYSFNVSSTSVDSGSDFPFSFNLATGYDQSKYVIKVNGEAVSLTDNAYTIKNIESDMVITVEGVEKNTYVVTFNSNGGTAVTAQNVSYNEQVSILTEPNKTGYTFDAWYADADLKIPYDFASSVTADITLYAKWTAASADYIVNHWQENVDSKDANDTKNYTLVSSKLIKGTTDSSVEITSLLYDGFTYEADISNSSGKIAADGSTVFNLYYSRNSYTITYSDSSDPATFKFGAAITPYQPLKEGYSFVAWYEDQEWKTLFKDVTMPAENLTLYAKWNANKYVIIFNSNGGSAVDKITANYGTNIDEPTDPTKTNYTFAGWFKDTDLTQAWDFATDTVTVDGTTLYAKWTAEEYTINFYNGIELVTSMEYTIETESMDIPKFSQEGYTFSGWFEKGSSSAFFYSPGVTVGNKELYAKLEINHYTITFNSNGGSSAGSVTQDYNTNLDPLPTPTYEGHTFAGWFEDNGTFNIEFTAKTMPARDITLYAKWEPKV